MNDIDAGAALFSAHRPALIAVAYRMLGSVSEAEDVAQEAFLRFREVDPATLESPRAWLTTVVTRLCLDQLKSARARREQYVGPWLPEPVRTDEPSPVLGSTPGAAAAAPVDPESISLAFLVLLESLTPLERAAYLLHEVFDYSHGEVASILGRDEAACRQLVHRAREHVAKRKPRFARDRDQHLRLLGAFLYACQAGDVAGLERLLAGDVVATSDGGGKATAAMRPVAGANAVARLHIGLIKKAPADVTAEVRDINGWPALIVRISGRTHSVLTIETDGDRIYAIRTVVNPDKLAHV